MFFFLGGGRGHFCCEFGTHCILLSQRLCNHCASQRLRKDDWKVNHLPSAALYRDTSCRKCRLCVRLIRITRSADQQYWCCNRLFHFFRTATTWYGCSVTGSPTQLPTVVRIRRDMIMTYAHQRKIDVNEEDFLFHPLHRAWWYYCISL